MASKIVFENVSGPPDIPDDYSLAARAVSDRGTALFLLVEKPARDQVKETSERGIGIFPKPRMEQPRRFALLEVSDEWSGFTELGELDLTFPLVDLFPDGRVLVAAARSQWRGRDDYDKNGVVIDPWTGKQTRFLLGDGIEALSIDSLGRIWVSYFDEGIFGNFGWGGPGPAPIGAAGLNCFTDDGDILWSFPIGSMADCYAMNVRRETAWVYFYTDFPLCRVSNDFQRSHWETGLRGCSRFAVDGSSVLFSGQYEEERAVGHLAVLGEGKLKHAGKVELVLPDESPISSGELLGRGAEMHYFDESGWYRTRLVEVKV